MIAGGASVAAALLATRLRRFEVEGTSMRPTFEPGDRVLAVRTTRVRPGQIVVVPDPREPARLVVKRVVAATPLTVTVRGDNPPASTDSRAFGDVRTGDVRGRVVYRYSPPPRRGRVP